ncbi:MAG: hypothetical protein C4557_10860 [Anaerolineaceae bacterium]|jgi:hypothetical protein|nr:MAG: hypothetical protein C4557_10860 [Anaerolineaceae bacterium]
MEVADEFQPQAQEKGQILDETGAHLPARIEGNPSQIRQVYRSLIVSFPHLQTAPGHQSHHRAIERVT